MIDLTQSQYWADEVIISRSGRIIYATTRARGIDSTGYLSAFSVSRQGRIEGQLFQIPTTNSGGISNGITLSDWSDDWIAVTDTAKGFVEIWQVLRNKKQKVIGAKVVSHLDIPDPGCCANSIWYD